MTSVSQCTNYLPNYQNITFQCSTKKLILNLYAKFRIQEINNICEFREKLNSDL